jgi:hypothetical protein
MSPDKYKAELATEQLKHAGKCIYHLTKNHPTSNCFIKKECEKLLANCKPQTSNGASGTQTSQGQLHHLMEEQIEEEVVGVDDVADSLLESSCNDTNEADLYYFAHISNHYLHLVKSRDSPGTHHQMDYPIIANSEANFHMFKNLAFFYSMIPTMGHVILGDGQTKLSIQGIGSIKWIIDDHELMIDNVHYVPDLSESIYSLLQHIKQPGHGIQSSYETGLYIKFPSFQTTAVVGSDDIYLDAVPSTSKPTPPTDLFSSSTTSSPVLTCGDTCSSFPESLLCSTSVSKDDNNLLKSLRRYYNETKTKRQLSSNVPAGFHQANNLQQMYQEFLPPPQKGRSSPLLAPPSDFSATTSSPSATETIAIDRLSEHTSTNKSVPSHVPIL